MPKEIVVIGGGAAGFFCAVNAARIHPGASVLLLEKTHQLLSKVKVSGGGRCNVTHACFSIPDMVRNYPRGANFLKKSFHWFFTNDTIEWFRERGVELKTEADGRMFPVTNSSQTIIDCLLQEANRYQVKVRLRAEVKDIKFNGQQFSVVLNDTTVLDADAVCVASGGYAKSVLFNWLTQLGHSIEAPVPSLFTFNLRQNPITQLMGVSVPEASVKIAGTGFVEKGPVLITHWGLSGPAVLRLSAWAARELAAADYQFTVIINWLSGLTEPQLREQFQELRFQLAARELGSKNPFGLPQRLWDYHLQQSGINAITRWSDLPSKDQNRLIKNLNAQELEIKGKTTFKEEFVTAGGIALSEIDPNTMQSKIIPGLFFAGEVMNVDGITGGFNFQHAWTSGFIAAKHIGVE